MNRFAKIVTGWPRAVLLAFLLATVYVGYGVTKLRTRNNNDSELPKDDPIVGTNDRLKAVFGDKAVVLIGIRAENVYTTRTLQKVAAISEALKQVDGVIEDEILSLSTVNNVQGRDWGLEVGPLLDEVPQDADALRKLRTEVGSNNLVNGKLVSTDGTLTLIRANVNEGYDHESLHRQVNEIAEKFRGPEQVYVAGDAYQSEEIDEGIQKDVSRLLPAVLLLTLIGYFLSFRTWRGVWLPMSVTLLSVLWTMGVMGHIGLAVTVVSSAVPILMVAVSSSYGIHVVHWYYDAIRKGDPQPARTGLVHVIPAILLVAVVSALGSASLVTFRVASIREFGIITALGVVGTTVVALVFAPAVLALLKVRGGRAAQANHWLDRSLASLARFAVRRRKVVIGGTLALFAVSAVGVSRLTIGTDFATFFPSEHPLRRTFDVFNERLGGARRLDIMIDGSHEDAIKDPELLGKIAAFQRYAESFPAVGSTSSFADVLRRINQEMNGGDPAFNTIPPSRELIAQYLLLYAMSGDAGDFGDMVDYDFQRAKLQVTLTSSEQRDHRELYDAFRRYAAEHLGSTVKIEFGGDVMFWLGQIHYIAVGKMYNIVTGIAFVLLICGLIFRSLNAGLYSIAPLVVATTLTFGVMGFLGIRLDMGTAIITSIAVGVGVDFSLHYLVTFREELGRHHGQIDLERVATDVILTGGKPIMFDMISNILGFTVLIFSGFMPLRYFGWLVSLTMLTVGIGVLLTLPALIATWRPRFLFVRVGRDAAAAPSHPAGMRPAVRTVVASLAGFAVLLAAPAARAQSLTGRQIIARNDEMLTVDDERVTFKMTLVNKRGQQTDREVTWLIKNDDKRDQKALIRFAAPADVRGTAVLSIEHSDHADDQWLYLPALRKSRRISAANRSDSFVGSDFAYEDLGAEEMEAYDYRVVRQEQYDGVSAYVVEAVPNSPEHKEESGYSRRELWVRSDNFAIARVDFFDRQGELLKVFRASDIRLVPSTGSWRAHRMEMRNEKTGHTTLLTFGDFIVNAGVTDDKFSLRELERGS